MKLLLTTLVMVTLTGLHPVAAQANPAANQTPPCATLQPVGLVLNLMGQRLKLAADVARYKWNTRGKIEDLAREQALIAGLGQQAVKQGLPVAWAEHFFRAQIDASKLIQNALFTGWRQTQSGRFDNAPDLSKVTRPKLDTLTTQLIKALGEAWPQLQDTACKVGIEGLIAAKLSGPDYDAATISIASAPLLQSIKTGNIP